MFEFSREGRDMLLELGLTHRTIEIFEASLNMEEIDEIASFFGVSHQCIKIHRAKIFHKLKRKKILGAVLAMVPYIKVQGVDDPPPKAYKDLVPTLIKGGTDL